MQSLFCFTLCVLSLAIIALKPAYAADQKPAFSLMAWDYADDAKTMKAMADCGINMVAFVPIKALDTCKKYGLKAIVFDERVAGNRWDAPFDFERAKKALPAVIKDVKGHPAVYGYHLKDEPSSAEYPALAATMDVVHQLAPGKFAYVNLLPGDGESYDKYLEDYVKICKPTILSYDRYVLGEDGGFGAGFWTNIAKVRTAGIKNNIPFWNIVLTSAHWGYREVTAADIRLQVYGSLVYGARGISYYKFCSGSLPILQAPDLGNFRTGPLDEFGEKTQTWEWLRNTNRKVLNLAPTLVKLHSDDVYHIGGDIPEANHGPTDKSLIKTINGGEFVVGDFTHEDGSRYVMVVNKSLQHSSIPSYEFRSPAKSLEYVCPISGKTKPFIAWAYGLAPGQGVLIKLK
ncbi:MAG: hypothetical protein ACYC1M_10465 [Armatimonadota bacterium]